MNDKTKEPVRVFVLGLLCHLLLLLLLFVSVLSGPDSWRGRVLTQGYREGDPRPDFMRCLQTVLPDTGSVIVYNAAFENGRLEECCDLLPEFRSWNRKVERRIVDLLLPFRGFRYYHENQLGSASMKKVLPALTGQSYEHLAIQDGATASQEFLRVTFGNVPEAERQQVREQLERYCSLDTEGMVDITGALRKLAD